MKVSQRQPICITRLKKKPSSYNLVSPNDLTDSKESRAQLRQVGHNSPAQNIIVKQTPFRQSTRQSIIATQNHSYFQKQNMLSNQNISSINTSDQLMKRIRQLEQANQDLQFRNNELIHRLGCQQNEKNVLNARIEKLQKELSKLESQFQQQIRVQQAKTQISRFNTEIRLNSVKLNQSQNNRSTQGLGFRRLSFHEHNQYHSQDLSIKLKQYRNQLQVQKIKRINLERQIVSTKQNVKLEFKNELESLQHKIDNLKETIQRKDRQIIQKQSLIQRYIVKK